MRLELVSLTGADDLVKVDDLNSIIDQYHFAEFALLLMPEAMGENRFPDLSWIYDFKTNFKGKHTAMHLCGSAFIDFCNGSLETKELIKGFKRIQLNLNFGDVAGKYDPEKMVTQIQNHPEITFIIQYESANASVLQKLKNINNHALLFDSSAGQGISPKAWPSPLDDHLCGYAGGINPENIIPTIKAIKDVIPSDYSTWIDMETGIRTNDHFDISKVHSVLDQARPYIAS